MTGRALVVTYAVVATLNRGCTGEIEALLGQLRDQGEQVLRGRSKPVRIWTKAE